MLGGREAGLRRSAGGRRRLRQPRLPRALGRGRGRRARPGLRARPAPVRLPARPLRADAGRTRAGDPLPTRRSTRSGCSCARRSPTTSAPGCGTRERADARDPRSDGLSRRRRAGNGSTSASRTGRSRGRGRAVRRGRRGRRPLALPRLHRRARAYGAVVVRGPAADRGALPGRDDAGDLPGRACAGAGRGGPLGGAARLSARAGRPRAARSGRGRRSRSTSTPSTRRGRRSRSCPRSATAPRATP